MSVSHEDIREDLLAGGRRFDAIEATLKDIAETLKPLPAMQKDIAATKEIVEAWSTAKNLARFIKWAAGIAAAITGLFVVIKAGASSFWASGS